MSQSVIYMMITKHKLIYKVFKGLGIIYFVVHFVILISVNSKSIHQLKQNPIIWSDIFCWKVGYLAGTAVIARYMHTIHLWLVFLYPFDE